ncbi:MAG: alpha/beta fold hydrolase [Alphaproteobacteria bacterium]|nr:alpha/beta fold hydrolase [Alphaproteobacteria bacterium]
MARPLLRRLPFRTFPSTSQNENDANKPAETATRLNFPIPTLGGKQIWSDIFIQDNWRIQRNVYTGNCRLLDPNNIRRASGTYDHCRSFFGQCRPESAKRDGSDHLVLLVHGLGRSAGAFTEMEDALRRAGYETESVNYPSTRQSIAAHADNLDHIIETLDGVEKLSFVTHSLGALVVRELLSRDHTWQEQTEPHRIVMIAPPNQGSQLADRLKSLQAYQWITGESGQGLTSDEARKLPAPDVEFGIIAGGRGNEIGFNPLLPGDDDGLVTVAETQLDGARDFLLVPTTHGLVDDHPQTIDATVTFLRDGRFTPEIVAVAT